MRFIHFAGTGFVSHYACRSITDDFRNGVWDRLSIEQECITFCVIYCMLSGFSDFDESTVSRDSSILWDRLRDNRGWGVFPDVDRLGSSVLVLSLTSYSDPEHISLAVIPFQNTTWIQHCRTWTHISVDPFHICVFFKQSSLGIQIVCVCRSIFYWRIFHFTVFTDIYFNQTCMKAGFVIFGSRTSFDVITFGIIFYNNQSMLKLSTCIGIHTKICLEWIFQFDSFRDINKRPTTPYCTVQCGKFMICHRHESHKVLFDQLRMRV